MANFWGHDENLMSGYRVRNGITIYLRFTLSYGKDIGGYDATGGGYGALSQLLRPMDQRRLSGPGPRL